MKPILQRLLIITSVALLLIFGSIRAYAAFDRNLNSAQLGTVSLSHVKPQLLVHSTADHTFRFLLQSHVLAVLGKSELAAEACDDALLAGEDQKGLKELISTICSARWAIVNQDWQKAVSELTTAHSQVPSYQVLLSREIDFVLGRYYQSKWEETGSNQDLCTAGFYLSRLDWPDNTVTSVELPLKDCEESAILTNGDLDIGGTKGCVTLNPQLLDYPGPISVRLSPSACASSKFENTPALELRNLVFNSGLSVLGDKKPALAVEHYYQTKGPYELETLLELDGVSGVDYLAIAPKRDVHPDTLTAGKYRINNDHSYLVGGIGRGYLSIGCTWWGGASHGQTDVTTIISEEWSLTATLLDPPPGAQWCVLIFYNNNQQLTSDLDALFFSDLQNDITQDHDDK